MIIENVVRFKKQKLKPLPRFCDKVKNEPRYVNGYTKEGYMIVCYYNKDSFYTKSGDKKIKIIVWEDIKDYKNSFNLYKRTKPSLKKEKNIILVVDSKANEYLAYNKNSIWYNYALDNPIESKILLWRDINKKHFKTLKPIKESIWKK